jgi:twitching motility protein PilT
MLSTKENALHFSNFLSVTRSIMNTELPTDAKQGIASAVRHALMFAHSITDIMVHEGRPMMAKSAQGTRALHELFPAISEFVVTREHIVYYLAGYVEGESKHDNVQHYWDTKLKPILESRCTANFRLDGLGQHSLRYTLFLHAGGQLGLAMRITPSSVTALNQLALPLQLRATLSEATSGFLAITGPTGTGKTATAMSVLEHHNQTHSGHIVTIEDPVEVRLTPAHCMVTQREVGYDVVSFAQGMRDSLRMSPDVMLTSEIRDAETAEVVIQGGESGSLMVATMHGRTTTGTLRKILSYTGSNAVVLRSVLAGSLIAVVRQALIPCVTGERYILAADVLFNVGKVTQFIEDGDWIGLEAAIREERLGASEFIGMNGRLTELIKQGEVSTASALRETSDIPGLKRRLQQR